MPKITLDYSYPHSPDFVAHDYHLPDVGKFLLQAYTRSQGGFIPVRITEDGEVIYGGDVLARAVARIRALTGGGSSPEEAAAQVLHELTQDDERRATS